MIPSSFTALGFLLALIPGFLYLRLTVSVRTPYEQSVLQEIAEVLAVGLVTTGSVIALLLIGGGQDLLDAIRPSPPGQLEVQLATALAVSVFLTAVGIAWLAAHVRLAIAAEKPGHAEYVPSVWEDALHQSRSGHSRHVLLELKNGRTLDGVLRSYTVVPGKDGGRQISLWGDIRLSRNGKTVPTPYDFVVVDSSEIDYLALSLIPAPPPRPTETDNSQRRSTRGASPIAGQGSSH